MKVSAEAPWLDGKAPHLMCGPGDIAEIVLLPGDPGRVEMFESLCEEFTIIASNREYVVGTGKYHGTPVSVCSTGIGAPSTEIAILELMEMGAKALIRIGGTGVIDPRIKCGEMVINTAAMRLGGSSSFYAPPEYPAVASYEVVECLTDACRSAGLTHWRGICASVGSFFAGQGRPIMGKRFYPEDFIQQYQTMNIVNMEMEAETILTLGSLFGALTGSICAVHANRATDEWMQDFASSQQTMCKVALEAVCLLHQRYLKK